MPRMILDGTTWVLFIQSSIFIRLFIFLKNKDSPTICLVLLKHMIVLNQLHKLATLQAIKIGQKLQISAAQRYSHFHGAELRSCSLCSFLLSFYVFIYLFLGGIIPQVRIAHSWVKKPVVLTTWNCPHALNEHGI